MKPNLISPQSIAAVCALPIMAFCPTLSAQNIGIGTGAEQIVTLIFSETYTDANLKPRDENGKIYNDDLVNENEWYIKKYNSNDDLIEESENYEYGAKQVTVKISNKEFLGALADEGYISDPISGWSVKFVTSGEESDSSSGRFYAVKSGFDPVDLSDIISTYGDGYAHSEAENWSSKTTYRYTSNGDYTETLSQSWSISSKFMTNLEIQFSFFDSYLHLDGIFNESWALKSFGKGEDQYFQFAPGAAKFDNGSGTIHFEDEDQVEWSDPSVIKGSINFSAGKLFPAINDLDLYPDFEPNNVTIF